MTALRIKLGSGARMPTRATDGSACLDIYAADEVTVHAGESVPVRTGLQVQIDPGWCMLLFSRSGHGIRHGIRLANSVGVIDGDYRGEIIVGLRNDTWIRFDVKPGDRIAQALLVPVHEVELIEADQLSETVRGDGGLGSTGV
jgi:dUTP pyrophosphatase